MDEPTKMHGVLVSEEEVAKGLGFANVDEFKRWHTDIGREAEELKHSLRAAKSDAEHMRYGLKRTIIVLDKCKAFITETYNNELDSFQRKDTDKLLLAIDVVKGQGVDWDYILKD